MKSNLILSVKRAAIGALCFAAVACVFLERAEASLQVGNSVSMFRAGQAEAEMYPTFESDANGVAAFGLTLMWERELSPTVTVTAIENLPCSFFPLEVCDIGNDRIALSGISPVSGNTVLHVWQVRRPLVVSQYPSGAPQLMPKGVSRIVSLQDDDLPETKGVSLITQFYGESVRFLVHYDSGRLYEYSLDGTPKRLVSSINGDDGSIALDMDSLYVTVMEIDHADHGRLILLRSLSPTKPFVLLRDADRDSHIEGAATITAANLIAMGFYDQTKYLP
jgi:hypothetical protein